MQRPRSMGECWEMVVRDGMHDGTAGAPTPARVARFLDIQGIGKRRLGRPPPLANERCQAVLPSSGKPCKAYSCKGSDFCVKHEKMITDAEIGRFGLAMKKAMRR